MNGYNELISAIEYQKKLSHQYLDELSRLRPDRHKIEDIVNIAKKYLIKENSTTLILKEK